MPDDPKPGQVIPTEARYSSVIGNALDSTQVVLYLLAAIFLILLAVMAFFVVAGDMYQFIGQEPDILMIDNALEDILIVFIITGLIQTLIVYIKRHTIDPWLVLSVGLTAVIRRVLVFGAEARPWEDVALTAVLLFVIILGLFLVDRDRRTAGKRE